MNKTPVGWCYQPIDFSTGKRSLQYRFIHNPDEITVREMKAGIVAKPVYFSDSTEAQRADLGPAAGANYVANKKHGRCEDCPPLGYPTDETRCLGCPRRKRK